MEAFAWSLIALGALTTVTCAVHLTRLHRRDDADGPRLVRSLHRAAPALLAACALPLPVLLAAEASAVAWGLWGATTNAAALVYANADTCRDAPATSAARKRSRHRPRSAP